MREVSGSEVFKAHLSDARKSVDALIEFARAKSDTSSTLLRVVEDSVNKGFADMECRLKDAFNVLIESYNRREAVIAKVCPAEKPERDNDGTLMTGHGVTVDIRSFGITRVEDTKAWMLALNDEAIMGTGMNEETAMRIYSAVEAWRDAKLEADKENEK